MPRESAGLQRPARTGDKGGFMLNPGDKAPEFTGRDHTGQTVKLSDLKGKTVVLWFYPKADTPG
jgi:peroxiredoxin Q/BCP